MTTYALTNNSLASNAQPVIRSDGACVPYDPRNADFAAYQAWLAAGNTPSPAPALPAAPPTSVVVQSTSTPALNGTYAIDSQTRATMSEVVDYILEKSAFPDAQSPFPWPDASGTMHNFATITSFIAFAEVIADFVTANALGQTPATPLTIP